MSFSSEVKDELVKHASASRHCQLAELSAILHFCGVLNRDENGRLVLGLQTENGCVIRKCFTLLKKAYNIETNIVQRNHMCVDFPMEEDILEKLLRATKYLDEDGLKRFMTPVNRVVVKNSCCRRAFIRGAFLCIGSMSDPGKSYHLEFVCDTRPQAEQITEQLRYFEIDARIIARKKYQVVYIKEGSQIVDLLNVMEAYVSLMNFENERIYKEMRNSVNRRVNCEAANITKTVNASARQVEDIILIRDTRGLDSLPDNLRDMANVRLEYPDATLTELGRYLSEPVGKSGVNHRLRRLSEIAEAIRMQ
ncbi:MAG: DNA-binding protein WhiA [Lachnospiraceae bacterium]|nr:DNA-binding protein WhiA [Lachnospiraceae bacterium]